MSILSDQEIIKLVEEFGMIEPFHSTQVRVSPNTGEKVFSYGLGSYGYDIRLSPKQFLVLGGEHRLVDPKKVDPALYHSFELLSGKAGQYFVLPPNSYGLAVAVEKLSMPPNVTAIATGKSSYARVGVVANITPVEAGWEGYLTLELSNTGANEVKIYANEGICQLMFFQGQPCLTPYSKREGGGKYQNQAAEVTLAKG